MANIKIINESCKGVDDCFICAFVCPQDLFVPCGGLNKQGYLPCRMTDESRCTGCGNCMISCPDMAIVVHPGEGEDHDQR